MNYRKCIGECRGEKSFAPTQKHRRRSIRLKGYDYSQEGTYFITIVTQNRECLFGNIINGETVLNDAGKITHQCWLKIPQHFPHVTLDEFVIMPNHIHGIIVINNIDGKNVGANNYSPLPNEFRSPSKTIGSIIRGFKIGVTKWFRQNTNIYITWQRNYYEHIIRNEDELNRIREYIIKNPFQWQYDRENPDVTTVRESAIQKNDWQDFEEKIYGKAK